jgi:hypothetical protein
VSRPVDLVAVNLSFAGAAATLATAIPGIFAGAIAVSALLLIGTHLWETR